ncbi:MAG: pyrroloquinoline quinone precursor peptide PqqA [Gammaproteobacteria bacterium]
MSWHESRICHDTSDHPYTEDTSMAWQTPAYQDVRFGFEVTMYINNR